MDTELIVTWLSRVVHVGTAITLVGGSAFMLWVLLPAADQIDDAEHDKLSAAVGTRWRWIVQLGILLFLVTGLYNYWLAIPAHQGDSLYHALVGTKILLALVVFFIASALVGRSAKLQWLRHNRATWLKVLVLLAAIIVAISSFLKVRGMPDPDVPPGPTIAQPR